MTKLKTALAADAYDNEAVVKWVFDLHHSFIVLLMFCEQTEQRVFPEAQGQQGTKAEATGGINVIYTVISCCSFCYQQLYQDGIFFNVTSKTAVEDTV